MTQVKYVERTHTNSVKWDGQTPNFGQEGLLPFWVADMDFQVPECVTKALGEYISRGAFGYYTVPQSYYDAIITWEATRHNCRVEKDWIRFSPGVVSAFNWIVQYHTKPEDSVLVMKPVYYPFLNAVKNNGRNLVSTELVNRDGHYEIDFADMEAKIVENDVKLMIFCSPHNPVGRVWTKDELEKVFGICHRHGVYVISDEIHQDLTFDGHEHISALNFTEYYDHLWVLTAPSKTFNLAACQNSVIMIPDGKLRAAWDTFAKNSSVTSGNAFGYIAAEAAYREGGAWYEDVKKVIWENYLYVKETLGKELPDVTVFPLEGTYLLWLDLRTYVPADRIHTFMQNQCQLAFDYGEWFGGEQFSTFVRMNLATSSENVKEAVARIIAQARLNA